MGNILRLLGGIGKGFATITGVVTTIVGVVAGLHIGQADQLTAAIKTLVNNVPAVISAIGVILTAFGIGRKAGAALNAPPADPTSQRS